MEKAQYKCNTFFTSAFSKSSVFIHPHGRQVYILKNVHSGERFRWACSPDKCGRKANPTKALRFQIIPIRVDAGGLEVIPTSIANKQTKTQESYSRAACCATAREGAWVVRQMSTALSFLAFYAVNHPVSAAPEALGVEAVSTANKPAAARVAGSDDPVIAALVRHSVEGHLPTAGGVTPRFLNDR